MQKLDYSGIDTAILATLALRAKTFTAIASTPGVRSAAEVLEQQYGVTHNAYAWYRHVRKAGKIKFVGQKEGWKIAQQKAPS